MLSSDTFTRSFVPAYHSSADDFRAQQEEKRRRDAEIAAARALRIYGKDPKIDAQLDAGKITAEVAAAAIKFAEKSRANLQAQTAELKEGSAISLANRAVENPAARRESLTLPEFKTGTPIPGQIQLPDQALTQRLREAQIPGQTRTGRAAVVRSQLHPEDQDLRAIAGQSLQLAGARNKATEDEAKAAWEQLQASKREAAGARIPDQVTRDLYTTGQLTPEQAGVVHPVQAPQRLTLEQQNRARLAEEAGLRRGTQEWTDATFGKQGGTKSPGSEWLAARSVAFADILDKSHTAPQTGLSTAKALMGRGLPAERVKDVETVRKNWIDAQRSKWNAQHPPPPDLDAEMLQLQDELLGLQDEYQKLLSQ